MTNKRFDNIWDAIEDSPAEGENMRIRSSLMMSLRDYIQSENLTQAEAAKRFDVTQPRISDLMRGKINVFGIEALVNMVAATGQHIEIKVMKVA